MTGFSVQPEKKLHACGRDFTQIGNLAAAVSPALHQGRGGAQLDGLGLMEDDSWERLLFQC